MEKKDFMIFFAERYYSFYFEKYTKTKIWPCGNAS